MTSITVGTVSYNVHTFTSNDTFSVTSVATTCDILVVGGVIEVTPQSVGFATLSHSTLLEEMRDRPIVRDSRDACEYTEARNRACFRNTQVVEAEVETAAAEAAEVPSLSSPGKTWRVGTTP